MDDRRANVISRLTDEQGPALYRLCRSLAVDEDLTFTARIVTLPE